MAVEVSGEGSNMAVAIELNPRLAEMVGGAESLSVDAATVKDAVIALARIHRGIGARVFNCEGELRSVLKIEVNGQPVPADQAGSAAVSHGDTIRLSLG